MWTRFLNTLMHGLAVIVPIVITLGVVVWIFGMLDSWIQPAETHIPGLGMLIIVVLATGIGALALWSKTKSAVGTVADFAQHVPLVKIIYGPVKDFSDALFGDKKAFDKPVLVQLGAGFDAQVLGFVTHEDLSALGITDKVAVYFPQSYNFGGNLLILERKRLTPVAAESATVMAFIVSGGVTTVPNRDHRIRVRSAQRAAMRASWPHTVLSPARSSNPFHPRKSPSS